jgi:hypothetical protein
MAKARELVTGLAGVGFDPIYGCGRPLTDHLQ